MTWNLIRTFLFLFEPETSHALAKPAMRIMTWFLPRPKKIENNPIGLAAGFDKNCELLPYLPYFGFGHAEIGTVTPKPQGGNERPRLFRLKKEKMLFNRMGFNNLGMGVIAKRLSAVKKKLPTGFVVGVNIGKNKATSDQEAHLDYAKVAEVFVNLADYFVINVSSPNTPGLRALQTVENLIPIVKSVQNIVYAVKKIPIFVKLAPEVEGEDLKNIISALEEAKIDGLVLTNTLAGTIKSEKNVLSGGYSGTNLTKISLDRLLEARIHTLLPIISVGGIMSVDDALLRLNSGADRIQLYTGYIYAGPFFARKILKRLS